MGSNVIMDTLRDKNLPFCDAVVMLQSIVPYDLFSAYHYSLCHTFRSSHDETVGVVDFLVWFDKMSQGDRQRDSIYDRLVGHLAVRKVGTYDALWVLLRA